MKPGSRVGAVCLMVCGQSIIPQSVKIHGWYEPVLVWHFIATIFRVVGQSDMIERVKPRSGECLEQDGLG